VGSQWSTRGGDADRTELSRSTVIAHQQVNIGGQAYPVWVIDTHTDISGAESGDRDQRWWWSPDLAAPLRWTDRISASRSGATYSNDLTVSMTRVP
jgi:hypothetical protein